MKIVRFGRAGAERPGVIDGDGKLRDLSRVIDDVTGAALAPAALRRLRAAKLARLPLVRGRPRLGCPLASIGKMVCIGLNYTGHAAEVGMALPKEPTLFIKAPSAICGPDDPIVRPRGAVKLDYEVELGVVMGRDARYVREADALGYVAGYCLVNDVSDAPSRWSTAARPRRARAPTRSARRARGWPRPTRSATRSGWRCGRRSTVSDGRTATPRR
jgi:2-keto-4-pentenoate hydratase/2-oxohepta-3-ene-1,7-dioic acid hydratase in catechol pathway